MSIIEKRWPLKPTHISNDIEELNASKDENDIRLGIIPNQYLKGILTEISATLNEPVTVMEFCSDSKIMGIRTERVNHPHDLRINCKNFREEEKCKKDEMPYCHYCDDIHTKLFYNVSVEKMRDELINNISSKYFLEEYKKTFNREPGISILETENRCIIEYDCPMLGYRELIFPIIFDDKIIGVLFVGQLLIEDQAELIKQIRSFFYEVNKDKLYEYFEMKHGDMDQMMINNKQKYLLIDKYNELKNNINNQINNIELRLKNEMTIHKKNYISEKFNNYMVKFKDGISGDKELGNIGLKKLWSSTQSILEDLYLDFPVKNFIIFGLNNFIMHNPEYLSVVASKILQNDQEKNKLKFDINNFAKISSGKMITSKDDNKNIKWNKYFIPTYNYDPDEDLIIYFPSSHSIQNTIVILIKYDNQIWPKLKKIDEEVDKSFENAITSFYTLIVENLSSLWAATSLSYLKINFQIQNHEISHISADIDAIREVYLSNPDYLKSLSNDKIIDINKDLKKHVKELNTLLYQYRLMTTNKIEVKKDFFPIFSEIIFKWIDNYKLETEYKHCQIIAPILNKSDPLRTDVYGDMLLLDQLVMNIVDNAIKYCEYGTNIYIDCRKKNNLVDSPHILTIINYGLKIDKNINIYDLYTIGDERKHKGGNGTGLYIADRIAQAHGGNISHKSIEVYKYNVPFLHEYYEKADTWGFNEMEIKEAYLQIKDTELYKEIISMRDGILRYYPNKIWVEKSIHKALYKNIFTIILPSIRGKT
jgi:signal transduction histidine kinase